MLVTQISSTIVAQCTPTGSGAIALLRVSGKDAISIVARISSLVSKKSLLQVPSHTIHYGQMVDITGHPIDHVLFLLMKAPHTFTGEDTVEITCHNNQFIIEAIINRVIEEGGRQAQPGEFSQQAVLNNKIDLLQAEAIQELVGAHTQQALKHSLAQLEGSLSHYIRDIEQKLMYALALCDASFEFLDDEQVEFSMQIREILTSLCNTIAHLTRQFDQQLQIRNGFKIAIVGSVNTGKSSLFNTLVGSARAIVSDTPGTTRDSIEAGLYKQGMYWTLTDTAGLRATRDAIEQEGITRSFEQAHLADILIFAHDSCQDMTTREQEIYHSLDTQYPTKLIPILTKADLAPATRAKISTENSWICVSSFTKQGISELEEAIRHKIDTLVAQGDSPFLLNKRQYTHLLELEKRLNLALPLLAGPATPFELLSIHLQEGIGQLAELTGKSVSESAMDTIFRSFCIGK